MDMRDSQNITLDQVEKTLDDARNAQEALSDLQSVIMSCSFPARFAHQVIIGSDFIRKEMIRTADQVKYLRSLISRMKENSKEAVSSETR